MISIAIMAQHIELINKNVSKQEFIIHVYQMMIIS
jgi:hypothetical protein